MQYVKHSVNWVRYNYLTKLLLTKQRESINTVTSTTRKFIPIIYNWHICYLVSFPTAKYDYCASLSWNQITLKIISIQITTGKTKEQSKIEFQFKLKYSLISHTLFTLKVALHLAHPLIPLKEELRINSCFADILIFYFVI